MHQEKTLPLVSAEQIDNKLVIRCPSPLVLDRLTDYLTFVRITWERDRGRFFKLETPEPCYTVSPDDPYTLVCPAGFETMLTKRFRGMFEFSVSRTRSERVIARTRPDWSRVAESDFRDGQWDMFRAMTGADRGRVVVATAVGKLFLIVQYAKVMPQARIVVSTHSKQVLIQIYEALREVFGDEVGIVSGTKKTNRRARILCISQGTLYSYLDDPECEIDALLVDEYHEWGSLKRLAVLDAVKEARLFGLSASDERDDKAEFRLNGYFGPIIAEMGYAEAVKRDLIAPICVVWVPVRSDNDPVDVYLSPWDRARFGIWRYGVRNKAIADTARLFGDDEQVLISVKTIEHALFLRKYFLPEFAVIYAPKSDDDPGMRSFESMGLLDGVPPMTEERLLSLKHRFAEGTLKKAISTKVWSQGMNFNKLRVLIRADGMNSTIADTQWPGRLSRLKEDGKVGLLFDFTDEHHEPYRNKASERQRRYEKHQWRQIMLHKLKEIMLG